jgi:hypothetical protein
MDNSRRDGNAENSNAEESSPLLSRPSPDLPLTRPYVTSNDTSESPNRVQPKSDLLLEAQRRSADFHLGEYLDLRRSIWSQYAVNPKP